MPEMLRRAEKTTEEYTMKDKPNTTSEETLQRYRVVPLEKGILLKMLKEQTINGFNMKDEEIELSTPLSPNEKELFDTVPQGLKNALEKYRRTFTKIVELEMLYENVLKREAEEKEAKQKKKFPMFGTGGLVSVRRFRP